MTSIIIREWQMEQFNHVINASIISDSSIAYIACCKIYRWANDVFEDLCVFDSLHSLHEALCKFQQNYRLDRSSRNITDVVRASSYKTLCDSTSENVFDSRLPRHQAHVVVAVLTRRFPLNPFSRSLQMLFSPYSRKLPILFICFPFLPLSCLRKLCCSRWPIN